MNERSQSMLCPFGIDRYRELFVGSSFERRKLGREPHHNHEAGPVELFHGLLASSSPPPFATHSAHTTALIGWPSAFGFVAIQANALPHDFPASKSATSI
jgi:hypothetical protein